jgi:2-polyprenyl-6-methoxyphenol hydroxylase-like FAD-dependent oxidoreductase
MLWRGAVEWPVYADGRTMVIAGGNATKFVFYPIHTDASKPEMRLTNWAIMAPIGDGRSPPPRREDWNRLGRREEALPFVRDKFRLGFVDPASLIEATGTFHEYPMCDRDPVPRWSFGRVTLPGDAAHPMYPVGGHGASQAILDARCVARLLAKTGDVALALAAYEAARLPVTAKIVRDNRLGGQSASSKSTRPTALSTLTPLSATPSSSRSLRVMPGWSDLIKRRSMADADGFVAPTTPPSCRA